MLGPSGEWEFDSEGHLNWASLISFGWPKVQAGGINFIKSDGGNNHSMRIGSFDDGGLFLHPGALGLSIVGNTTTSGSVGIGTTSPTANLEVVATGSTEAIYAKSAAGIAGHFASLNGIGLKSEGQVQFEIGESDQAFVVNNAPAAQVQFRIDGDLNRTLIQEGTGNVGIGTTIPSTKLHVEGQVYTSGQIDSNADTLRLRTAKTPRTRRPPALKARSPGTRTTSTYAWPPTPGNARR